MLTKLGGLNLTDDNAVRKLYNLSRQRRSLEARDWESLRLEFFLNCSTAQHEILECSARRII